VAQIPETPEMEPLTRTQVLIAMGVTAVVLLLVSKFWMQLGSVNLLPVTVSAEAILQGVGLGLSITIASSIVYRFWAAYRVSADYYLELVLKPLLIPDLVWLGLPAQTAAHSRFSLAGAVAWVKRRIAVSRGHAA